MENVALKVALYGYNRIVLSPLSVVSFIIYGMIVDTSAFFHCEQGWMREGFE